MVFRLNEWITSACARRCRFLSLSFIANSPSSFILVATRVQTKIKKKRKVMKKRQNCEEDFERTKQKKFFLLTSYFFPLFSPQHQQDVRDLLLLAAALWRRFDQASPILVEQRLDSVPRIRGPGPRLHWRPRLVWFGLLRQRQLLRQQILGHVEVADVRLQQRRRSHPRSQGVRQGVPELLRQMRRLRQHQASAMCWLLVLQTEVGPDGRWCQTSRWQTSLSSLVLGFECRFTWWYSIIKL